MVCMAKQRNSVGCHERPHRCWTTRTTGVPDVFPVNNFTPLKFMLATGAYHGAHKRATFIVIVKNNDNKLITSASVARHKPTIRGVHSRGGATAP